MFWLRALGIRGLRILLYPVAVILFIVGWLLYVVGERRSCSEATSKAEDDSFEDSTLTDAEVEFGLIDARYLKSNS